MISIGEETVRPHLMLGKVADFYENRSRGCRLQSAGAAALEPLMIVVPGSHRGLHRYRAVHAADCYRGFALGRRRVKPSDGK
jgi:hypothetical protein